MPPRLALLIGAIFVLFAFRSDRRRGIEASWALWWPTFWYMVVASRPMGVWLQLWGVPFPGSSDDPTEGSYVDRFFFLGLTVIGCWILARRRFDWGMALRQNSWLTALLTFMALSILWSNYPYVSFKRYVKVVGSVVMALVILTEQQPFESLLTVLRRCLYIHLPMSIICTRYFRDIGVSFDWSGVAESWQGIATSKNTLGQVAMLGVLYFFQEVRQRWREYGWRNLHVVCLLMAIYLLKGSGEAISMTSVSICVVAVVIFLGIQRFRNNIISARRIVIAAFSYILLLVCLITAHSLVHFPEDSFFGTLISTFGRDITLTDRAYIWSDAYAVAAGNPLLGVGFGGFWIGRLANIPWNANMTWVLGQAHSGYVDTYLQIGLVGVFLLAGVIFDAVPRLLRSFADHFEFACFRITLFLTILFINITETTFLRGDHHLWLLFMVVLWQVPQRH